VYIIIAEGLIMNSENVEGRTMRTRRIGQAAALLVAPWAFVIANTGDVLTTEPGQDDTTARGAILISVAHPLADKLFTFAAMVGCLLLVPAVLGAMRLVQVKAARLGLIGGVLMILGYICYFGMLFQGYVTIALAEHGGATPDNIAIQDLTMNQAFFVIVALTFVIGNLIGTFLLGLALLRSHAIPRWAAICVLVWPVAHILGGRWGEVLGAAVEGIGLAVAGWCLLKCREGDADLTLDAEPIAGMETPESAEVVATHYARPIKGI
jgi:hypothetical protein